MTPNDAVPIITCRYCGHAVMWDDVGRWRHDTGLYMCMLDDDDIEKWRVWVPGTTADVTADAPSHVVARDAILRDSYLDEHGIPE